MCIHHKRRTIKTLFLAQLDSGERLVNFHPSMTRHLIVYLCVGRIILFRCKLIKRITKCHGNTMDIELIREFPTSCIRFYDAIVVNVSHSVYDGFCEGSTYISQQTKLHGLKRALKEENDKRH